MFGPELKHQHIHALIHEPPLPTGLEAIPCCTESVYFTGASPVAPFEQVCVPKDNVGCIKGGSIPSLSTSPVLRFFAFSGSSEDISRSTEYQQTSKCMFSYSDTEILAPPSRSNAPLASTVDTHTSTSLRELFALRSMLYRRQN